MARALRSSPPPSSTSKDDKDDNDITPITFRRIVANSLTKESYDLFQTAYDAGVGGFEFMRKVNDLATLKQRHLVSGRAVGAGQCIWANDYALRTVATELRLCVHIMDEESGRARSSGISSGGSRKRRRGSARTSPDESEGRPASGIFVTIQPENMSINDDGSNRNVRHICLQRTRRQHFNLIIQRVVEGEGGETIKRGIFDALTPRMQELWGFVGSQTSENAYKQESNDGDAKTNAVSAMSE